MVRTWRPYSTRSINGKVDLHLENEFEKTDIFNRNQNIYLVSSWQYAKGSNLKIILKDDRGKIIDISNNKIENVIFEIGKTNMSLVSKKYNLRKYVKRNEIKKFTAEYELDGKKITKKDIFYVKGSR